MSKGTDLELRRDLRETNAVLAELNRELAARMMDLAAQTGDVQPLMEAVQSLATANSLYTQNTTPASHAEIQKRLGDALYKVGKAEGRKDVLEHAAIAYRGAITIASMLGADETRRQARKSYMKVENLLGRRPKRQSVFSAA